jgi:hypothetical protein
MGTFYFDFGLFGVFAGMLLVGVVYRFVDTRLLRTRDEGLIVILASVLPFLVVGLRDSFPDTVLHLAFVVVPLVGVVELARRRGAIRQVQWKRPGVLWPVAVGIVLAVVFAGVEAKRTSGEGVPIDRAAIQPAMLVGAANPNGPAALPAVIASVKAALHGAPIPSPLVPSFYDLDASGAPPGCYGANGAGVTTAKICYASGDGVPSSHPTPGHKTLVVFGDTNVELWTTPLLAMAGKDNWDVIPMWKAECPTAILYAKSGTLSNQTECRTWYAWALRTMAKLHPDAVFNGLSTTDSGDIARKDASGIASLLVQERKLTKHVVLMLNAPYLASLLRPRDCLYSPGATLRTCTGVWSGRSYNLNAALPKLARAQHVGVIDPTGWFCYKHLCPLAIGHTIAYADYGRVSEMYATALSPPFRAAFRAALHPR